MQQDAPSAPPAPGSDPASVAARFPARLLLDWYARARRRLPWRALPGETADPYHVWVSEIMLQQTSVVAVIPYYARFLARFPDVGALAAAEQHEMLPYWAGLGYYARGRNLHAAARIVAAGGFPRSVEGLAGLPGIGAYTARAIAAIAFGIPAVPVDGNVERIASRLFAIETPLPAARPALARAAASLGDDADARAAPSDFAQALFDLGATLCTPRSPACVLCPWTEHCAGRRAGIAATLPRRAPKTARPQRYGVQYLLEDEAGRVLLRRRGPTGLFAGMSELPGTAWRAEPWSEAEARAAAPAAAAWRPCGTVRHTLTHMELELEVWAATVASIPVTDGDCRLVARDALDEAALPTVMRKCIARADAGSGTA